MTLANDLIFQQGIAKVKARRAAFFGVPRTREEIHAYEERIKDEYDRVQARLARKYFIKY